MAIVEDKIDFIMLVISSFAKRFGLSNSEAYRYLAQYKGLELCEANFCRRQGGTL
jgi:hypothetical protein